MATKRITEDFYEITNHRLSNVSFLKLFNILQDDDGNNFLNIFRSFSINEDVMLDIMNFITYETEEDEFSENIAYTIYQNVNLWWIIFLSNNIINPFEELGPGQNIKVLRESFIPLIIREIRDISEK